MKLLSVWYVAVLKTVVQKASVVKKENDKFFVAFQINAFTSAGHSSLDVPARGKPFGIMFRGTLSGPPSALLTFFRPHSSCLSPLQNV
jgi:hypothetical protein